MFSFLSKTNSSHVWAFTIFSLGLSFTALSGLALAQEAEENEANHESAALSVTTLPQIDRGIHDAMQSKSYGDAIKLIEAAIADDSGGPPDYLRYLQGIALTEEKKFDEALETFEQLEQSFPDSDWISRSRFGRAHVYVLRRQYIEAGQVYRQEAERLLSRGRKDSLAQIYLEFADRYFEGIPADDPSKAKQPDYQQALTYYIEASKLGTTEKLAQQIDFRIARCQEELNQSDEAIASYQRFLDQYGDAAESGTDVAPPEQLAEARFRIGEVHLKAGRPVEARRIWQNFLSSTGEQAEIPDDVKSFLSRAQYRLAHTWGLPDPASVGDLELAVTAAERFLERYPSHELAPQAELEIAQGFAKHGRHTQAIERLSSLLQNETYKESKQIPVAREMIGREYLAQGEYDRAIESWKEFLEKHPTDPKWPSVQGQIVDTEYAKGKDAQDHQRYDEARALWLTFLNKYPLDARASSILLQFGRMKFDAAERSHQERVSNAVRQGGSGQDLKIDDACIQLYEEAISDWRRVVTKYPETDDASHAAFLIGVTLEDKLGRLAESIDSYRLVKGKYDSQAGSRITRLTTPQLQVVTERKFRSNETPKIRLVTRNLEKVDVKVYRVDMVDYFRKMHLASGVETLDIALIDPDKQFLHTIEEFESYKQIERNIDLPVDGPGVTAVTVSSEKLESTTMVVVSDLDMVVKASRNELFLFVEDMLKQAPAADVKVLISDGENVFAEATTNQDGIVQQAFEQLKTAADFRVFAIRDDHTAATVNGLQGLAFAKGLSPRGYVYTDRPAYRAGQAVNIKGIVRWVEHDRHTFKPGESLRLDIYDSKGRQLLSQDVALGDFGTISGQFLLPVSAPQGDYRVHLHRAKSGEGDTIGDLSFDARFVVAEYQLNPVQISIDLEREIYFRGEPVRGTIQLQYYYGMPLAGESIQYRFGSDGELISATTDQEGNVAIELETERFHESQPLPLVVEYPERNLQSSKTVFLATRGFAVTASTMRDVFISGESLETLFKVTDPAGKPVGTELKIEVFEVKPTIGGTTEKLLQTRQLQTDDEFGEGRFTLELTGGGEYLVRGTGVDQFGNQVSGQTHVQISGSEDTTRLRILTDRLTYKAGEQASVNLHWRETPALALITMEGARVLNHRLVMLQEGDNPIDIPMSADTAPNVFLNVAVMQRNEFYSAQTEFRVTQEMRISLKPLQDELAPGDDLTVEIEVTDPTGKPLRAEVSLAVIHAGLLNDFQEVQAAINEFFGVGYRRPSVRQRSSCTFDYRPDTRAVSQFLLAEEDRRALLERESRALTRMGDLFDRGGIAGPGVGQLEGDFAVDANAAGVLPSFNMEFGMEQSQVHVEFLQQEFDAETVAPGQVIVLRGSTQLQQQAAQRRTVVRFRTETRNGRQIQVPYLALSDAVSYQLPASPRYRADVYFNQLAASHLSGQGAETPAAFAESMLWQDRSFNGVTAAGKLVTINASGQSELTRIVREQNLQLLPRNSLSETAFWDPTIVTDADGKATVTLTMPQRSTAWRLRAKGIDSETLAGESTADVITKKSLFAELKLPLAFTAGDHAQVPVEIHHSQGEAKQVTVKLKATIGEKSVEQTRQLEIKGSAISRTSFDVDIESAEVVAFELTLLDGEEVVDEFTQNVRIRPYGFPVYQTTGGSSSQSTLALLDFDSTDRPEDVALRITIGPSLNRWLLESVLGSDAMLMDRCLGPTSTPNERSTSDILGGVAVAKMMGAGPDQTHPETQAIRARVIAAMTQLVSSQNEQGGWSWSSSTSDTQSDPYLSARVMWAWSVARQSGFPVPQAAFELGKSYLQSAFAASSQGDLERQAILLHAMSVSGCGDFALANRLYRERNRLAPAGLVYLMLTMDALKHPEMARDLFELVDIPAGGPLPERANGRSSTAWMRDAVELRAIYLLALQSLRPNDPAVSQLANSLLASRIGSRWPIEKANGPAIAAMANWLGQSQAQSEKYRLDISVNDQQLTTLTIDPAVDGTRHIDVPVELLRNDKPQKIEFQLVGRATFSYTAVLSGYVAAEKIKSSTKTWTVNRRYEPAQRMLDGRDVPRGFEVVDGSYRAFTNPLTQLAVGTRAEVTVFPRRHLAADNRSENQDYLVLTEPIPAGATVLAGSVRGSFERYEIEPGRILFFIGDKRYPGDIHYTLIGFVPGQYQAAPSMLRDFYEPGEFAVAEAKPLQILPSGSQSVDQYQLTPDELYYLGEQAIIKAEYDLAHEHLSQLYKNWQLDPDKQKNVVHWLFSASLAKGDHGDTVRYFEILKEKFPDIEITFQDILRVADSYREIGEYERGYLVYRATVEGSFERESQVAGFLNARGEFVRSVQEMERLLRDYPAESYLATATYALAQETYRRAATANGDEKIRSEGLTRVHLIDSAIKMLDHFLTVWPSDPANDEASFALATALIDLEQYDAAIDRSGEFALRYPESRLLDSYWYMIGYSHFELEQPEAALEMCRKVAEATFRVPETGMTRPADNRWEAVYIMGQVYHSLGQAAKAIAEYTKVKERFADAAEAIEFFNRKSISMDEVTTLQPDAEKQVELKFRNIEEAVIKVYRIDLMKFGLMQRNLDRITAINLAGIRPYHEERVKLGDGRDYRDRSQTLSLPLDKEGAYLMVCRGDSLYTSGLVLVSPLTLQVQEDAQSGRVRVSVKDSTNDGFVSGVHAKVIGSANEDFVSGDTDLRGLFIADDIRGSSTIIAATDAGQYAFFRGDTQLQPGSLPTPNAADAEASEQMDPSQVVELEPAEQGKGSLRDNLFRQNGLFQEIQKGNYDDLMNNDRSGIKSKEAY